MLERIISLFAPHTCNGCGREGHVLCGDCANRLPAWPATCYRCGAVANDWSVCGSCRRHSALHHVYVATHYEEMAKDTVWRLKFAGARAATLDMAQLMTERIALPAETVMVHVPAASSRVRLRGYDQASLLARELARLNGMQRQNCLVRLGQQRQVGAGRAQRLKQLEGAFRMGYGADIKGAHILLVDDVLTTGATLESAAKVLKQAGAQRVDAVVFAHA